MVQAKRRPRNRADTLSRRKKLVFATVAVVVPLVLLEGAARVWMLATSQSLAEAEVAGGVIQTNWLHRMHSELNAAEPSPQIYEPDVELFWRLRPNTQAKLRNIVFNTRGKPVRWELRVNADGHRGPSYPDKAAGPVIACFGDSCTFGYRTTEQDTYPAQLQAFLRGAGQSAAAVVNYGVPGYTTFQGRRLLEQVLGGRRPDIVILAFGGNDHEGDRLSDAQKAAEITPLSLTVARWLDHLAIAKVVRRAAPASRREPDAAPLKTRVPHREFEANLRGMVHTARRRGARVMLLDLVFVGPIHRATIARVAEDLGVDWIDGREVLRAALGDLRAGRRWQKERAALDHFWDKELTGYLMVDFPKEYYRQLFADPDRRDMLRYFMAEPVHANYLGNRVIAEAVGKRVLSTEGAEEMPPASN